jgi:hypothetical protein
VSYFRLPSKTVMTGGMVLPAPGEASASGQATTDGNGNLAVQNLPPGTYAICASVPGAAYLDPCVWQQPIRLVVSAGTNTQQTLNLTKGVFVTVQLSDPAGLLPQPGGGPFASPKLLVGFVYGRGAYQGVSATGRTFQLAVPTGVPFTLRLFSTDVKVIDETGASVDVSGSQIPFQAITDQDVSFNFTVSGAAQK